MVTIQWEVWVWVAWGFFLISETTRKKDKIHFRSSNTCNSISASLQLSSLFLVLLQQLRASTIADAFPPTHQLICKCAQVVEIMKCWMLLYWQVLLSGGGGCRRGAKIRCLSLHAKGKTRHTQNLDMKPARQLTGHINYFIYSSLAGTKRKKSSPKAFYCIYLGIYNTSFSEGGGRFLCWPEKCCVFEEKSSIFHVFLGMLKKLH